MKLRSTPATLWLSATFFAFFPAAVAEEPFSHDDWTVVLQKFVDDRGFVDYEGLAADRAVFDRYVGAVESQSPESHPQLFPSRSHRLAYYINAYNALVFQGVLARGPEKKSVWSGVVSGLSFFVRMKVRVGGETMSLKRLEDDVIRAQFQDPRIHAALNCASISCPRLRRVAYSSEDVEEQLDDAMREFVADPRNCSLDSSQETLHLSKIFDWFLSDFLDYEKKMGNSDPRIVDYVNRYRDPEELLPREYRIKYLDYDKGINKQR